MSPEVKGLTAAVAFALAALRDEVSSLRAEVVALTERVGGLEIDAAIVGALAAEEIAARAAEDALGEDEP